MTRRGARRAAALLFAALAVWATWPLALHLTEAVPSDLGDPLLGAWILGWDADRARHLLRGLWNAPIYFPYRHTLAFSEHLLGIALPVAPLVWLAGTPIPAYNVAFIGSFLLAAFGMYLLVEELSDRRDAALLAGLIFGFSPARLAQISHLQVLMSGWMPIALLCLHRYLRRPSGRALAGFTACFLVQAFSNGYYLYFLALAAAIVLLAHAADHPREARSLAGPLALAGAAIVAALAPIALVYLDVRQTYGLLRSELDVTTFGADLGAYLRGPGAASARLDLWRWLPSVARPLGPEGELFPGLAALALAAAGFWPSRARGHGPGDHRASAPPRAYAAMAVAAALLSLGIRPAAWGVALPFGGIYMWLFEHLPGFDGLRVPARLSVLVLLAIAVAAGFGFTRLTASLGRKARVALAALLGIAIALEGIPHALPLAEVGRGGRPDRAAYTWVRDHEAGAVLELPAGALDARNRAALYGYQTLFHRHPIVNGFSGYDSPLQALVGGIGSPLLDIERFTPALRMLRRIGVRTIVFHPDGFADPAVGAAVLQALRADRAQVISEAVFPGTLVFRLAPADAQVRVDAAAPAAGAPLAPGIFTAAASQAAGRLPLAFDGDLDTRWLTGGRQTGEEWVELSFDRPRDIARITLFTSARSLSDFPRDLQIESRGDSGDTVTLFHGPVVEMLAAGLVRDPRRGPIDIELPPNRTRRLRLRQRGQTRIWFWAIDELRVWERR
ncbi:MAG: hypothetical protein IT176_00915 [Acidobacteria bacterium]|nr:hypothetical protein [Acidobacteriota bacterium]